MPCRSHGRHTCRQHETRSIALQSAPACPPLQLRRRLQLGIEPGATKIQLFKSPGACPKATSSPPTPMPVPAHAARPTPAIAAAGPGPLPSPPRRPWTKGSPQPGAAPSLEASHRLRPRKISRSTWLGPWGGPAAGCCRGTTSGAPACLRATSSASHRGTAARSTPAGRTKSCRVARGTAAALHSRCKAEVKAP